MDRKPETLSEEEIAKILPKCDDCIAYFQAVKDHCLKKALGGYRYEGYKLVIAFSSSGQKSDDESPAPRGAEDMSLECEETANNETAVELATSVSLKEKIIAVLSKNPKGMRSGKIASLLGVSKKEVNRTLYADKESFEQEFFSWKLKAK